MYPSRQPLGIGQPNDPGVLHEAEGADFRSLFDFLPVGAYRSLPDGRQVRANPALVALNGYASEAEMLAAVSDIGREWYVDPGRREDFRRLMERDGQVIGFVSEIYRHKTRERIFISENAHAVRGRSGEILFYEGTVEDVTCRVAAEQDLRRNAEALRLLTTQVPGMLYRVGYGADGKRRFSFVSDGVRELFGVSPEEVMADAEILNRFRHPEDPPDLERRAIAAVNNHEPLDLVFRILLANGTTKWAQMTSSVVERSDQGAQRVGVILDITARTEAEVALRERDALWKLALESTGDGVWDWNLATGEEHYSRRFLEMYGHTPEENPAFAKDFDTLTHPDDVEQMRRDRETHFRGKSLLYVNEHRVRCKDGSWKWVLARGMVIERDPQGRPLRMVGTHTDITERRQSQALIWQQANFDSLTGLPNRRMLRDRLEQSILHSRRSGLRLAVLFIDLDHFKQVNDTVGHAKGDVLLIEAAARIRGCVRESDTVARLGGDEFTVVLSELSNPDRAAHIARLIVAALGEAFMLDGEAAFVTASVGITLYPDDAQEIEDLLKHADQALYVAKGAGRNRVSHFTPELQEAAQTRAALAKDLRRAFSERQFSVHYQPIVELATGRVHKAEALVRWIHPQRGPVSPSVFIPIAESTGQIVEIGDWVFREAAAQVLRWRERFDPGFQLSVNKSPVQFTHAAGSQQAWFGLLRELGLPGQSMVLEITESLLLDAGDGVSAQLLELRDEGVGVSLDDFGTGYSSMSYLQRYDIDYLKIDQSFVRGLGTGTKDLALCKAITVMAHELGLQVIAEGVETEVQRALLGAAGCDYAQGYLFARPMPPSDFEAWLQAAVPTEVAAPRPR